MREVYEAGRAAAVTVGGYAIRRAARQVHETQLASWAALPDARLVRRAAHFPRWVAGGRFRHTQRAVGAAGTRIGRVVTARHPGCAAQVSTGVTADLACAGITAGVAAGFGSCRARAGETLDAAVLQSLAAPAILTGAA